MTNTETPEEKLFRVLRQTSYEEVNRIVVQMGRASGYVHEWDTLLAGHGWTYDEYREAWLATRDLTVEEIQ